MRLVVLGRRHWFVRASALGRLGCAALAVWLTLLAAPAAAQVSAPRGPIVGGFEQSGPQSDDAPRVATAVSVRNQEPIDASDVSENELGDSFEQACELLGESQACRSCPEQCCGCRHEFWVVDSRCAPTCCCDGLCQGADRLRYQRLVGDELVEVDRAQFFAALDPSWPITLYVHGNGLSPEKAFKAGLHVRDTMAEGVGSHHFVLWSWPAEGEDGLGLFDNLRLKLDRCHGQGYYMGWVIDRLDPCARLSLAGHSYGGRVVCSALQCLAANGVAGCSLEPRQYRGCRRIQAALLAVAMDNTSLLPGEQYGLAVTQVNRMLIAVNPKDRALQFYPRVSPSGNEALGLTGIPEPGVIPSQRCKVYELKTTIFVYKAHRFLRYTSSNRLVDQLRPYFFY